MTPVTLRTDFDAAELRALVDDLGRQRRFSGRSRLVAQQAVDALLHEALLPAPDGGLGALASRVIAFVPPPATVYRLAR